MSHPPVLSVVDYAAWEKGYMPPSEHILIDKLAYRGARVISSTWLGGNNQLWMVLEGKPLTNKQRKFMRDLIALMYADEDEAAPEKPQRFSIVNDGPDRFVLADAESDEPAPVYPTAAEAEAALAQRLAEQSP